MKFDIVVARYQENINWIENFVHNPLVNKIFIYNKGGSYLNFNNIKIKEILLPNLGREGYSYLTHVTSNYDYLTHYKENFTWFFQGVPHYNLDQLNSDMSKMSAKKFRYSLNFVYDLPTIFMENYRVPQWGEKTYPSKYNLLEWVLTYLGDDINLNIPAPIYLGASFGIANDLITKSNVKKYENILNKELNFHHPEAEHFCERLWSYIFNVHKQ